MIPARYKSDDLCPSKQTPQTCNPPTTRPASHTLTRIKTLALTIKHTVEFSNNRRTPPEPQSFRSLPCPGQFLKLTRFFRPIKFASVLMNWKELHPPAEFGTTPCSGEHEASRSCDVGFNPGAATSPFPAGVRLPVGLTWRTLHTFLRGRHFARSGLRHTTFPQVSAGFEDVMTPHGAALVTAATPTGPEFLFPAP
jgi:hypothetical protein